MEVMPWAPRCTQQGFAAMKSYSEKEKHENSYSSCVEKLCRLTQSLNLEIQAKLLPDETNSFEIRSMNQANGKPRSLPVLETEPT